MADIELMRAVLEFRREVNAQVPIVSTLLAAVAMTGAACVLPPSERSRLRTVLLVAFAGATLLFVFTTVLSTMIAAPMKEAGGRSAGHIEGLCALARFGVVSALVGIVTLLAAVGGMGFVHSRRAGWWIAGVASAVIAVFSACAVYLHAVMFR